MKYHALVIGHELRRLLRDPMDTTSAHPRSRFPFAALLLALLGGFPALTIGVMWAMSALGIDAAPDDVIFEVNGHQYPGLMDTVMAVSAAIVLGAGGVFALLKFWNELTAWPRDSLR